MIKIFITPGIRKGIIKIFKKALKDAVIKDLQTFS